MKTRALLTIVLMSRIAAADPLVQAIPLGDDKIVVVREGDKAPFTGQLFDGATALRWANWLQQYQTLLPATIEREQKICSAKVEYGDKVLKAEKERAAGVEQDLRKRLVSSEKELAQARYDEQNPSWYRTVWFGAGVGIATTLAVTYVAVQTTAK
jgi:hypothetical protein